MNIEPNDTIKFGLNVNCNAIDRNVSLFSLNETSFGHQL
jgi:hypothetical protein